MLIIDWAVISTVPVDVLVVKTQTEEGLGTRLGKQVKLLCFLLRGRLPCDWSRTNITPVFKKGNKHAPKNYRPVSLTSLVVKVLEHLIQRRLVKFLSNNDKLNPFQHGFGPPSPFPSDATFGDYPPVG